MNFLMKKSGNMPTSSGKMPGSPAGHAEEFWVKARELLAKQHGDADIDAASEQSFLASDAINHM